LRGSARRVSVSPDWLWTAGYVMEHCGAEYVGVLVLDDPAFCREIFAILLQNLGNTILEIGDIDFSYML